MADQDQTERDRQARDIFLRAVEIQSREAQAAFVEGACQHDASLRSRLEALLENHRIDSFLEVPAVAKPPVQSATPLAERSGTVIGRYKLLQEIGQGGMGVVYMAEQEEPVRRRVALKIIKLGMDTRSVVARFEAERQALALMDHPNIAKVLDGGATEDGRPYFVMELVRGIKITEYCDEHHLSTRNRLELFIKVCQAIQHAHQKGIIHRDIKPSNILVTINDGVPVPKVIDFGIAKATEGRLTDKTVFTQFEAFIGTPAYVSPEQAAMTSLDIDTRSDIYSLGVLLYELLAGSTPFDSAELVASGMDAMRKTIRDKDPLRPSDRLGTLSGEDLTTAAQRRSTDNSQLRHQLSGDLDWIVMKCLEKDRARRYETANGLATDLQRHLHHEPVLARPPSAPYRFRKLIQRNKLAFAAVTSVACVLVLGVFASTWQAIRATRAKSEALSQRKFADMQFALQAWEEGDLQRAKDLIAASQPSPGQTPLFEWRYLKKLCQDQSIATFGGTNDRYRGALFSGRDLLLLNREKTLHLQDFEGGHKQMLLEDPDGIRQAAFCPGNTNLLATVTEAGRIKVWDLVAKRVLVEFEGHIHSSIYRIAFSRDGKWLASTSCNYSATSDSTVKLWSVSSKEATPNRTFYRYSYGADSAIFSPDGSRLFSSGTESLIRVWDMAAGGEAATPLEGHSGWVGPLAMSPDGRQLASGGGESTILLWSLSSHKIEQKLAGHIAPLIALAFSPDSRVLASGGRDHTIRLWDCKTGQQLSLLRGHGDFIKSLAFSFDGERLVSLCKDGSVKVWPTSLSDSNSLPGNAIWLQDVAFSPDGQHLASVRSGGSSVDLWDLPTRQRTVLEGHTTETVMCPVFSPDGRVLATGGHDQMVRLWGVIDHQPIAIFTNSFPVGSLAFSPDGRTLVVGGSSFYFLEGDRGHGGLEFWDVPSHTATRTVEGDTSDIVDLAMSSDGSLLATGHVEGAVSIWDPQTRRLLHQFPSQFGRQVISLAFSPTEPLLASSDVDGNIVLYNTAARKVLNPPMRAHTWRVMSLAFSPDGRTLASAGEGGGLKLWNVATRQVALNLKGHTGTVCGIAFSRDGNFLASCGADSTVRLWPAVPLDEIYPSRNTKENQ